MIGMWGVSCQQSGHSGTANSWCGGAGFSSNLRWDGEGGVNGTFSIWRPMAMWPFFLSASVCFQLILMRREQLQVPAVQCSRWRKNLPIFVAANQNGWKISQQFGKTLGCHHCFFCFLFFFTSIIKEKEIYICWSRSAIQWLSLVGVLLIWSYALYACY